MALRQGIAAGVVMALLTGGFAYGGTNAVGVQVPTLSEYRELEERVSDLDRRVAALESGTPTTTLPPATTTTSTLPLPPTTTTTIPSGVSQQLPADGVVLCDDCVVEGQQGFVYTSVNLNGRSNVTLRNVTVNGARDSGPLQSGTVNIRGANGILVENVVVSDSPRSCFSLEGSTDVTLLGVKCLGAEHLGVHGGYVNDITIVDSEFADFSRRNVEIGWESGAIKLLLGSNIVVANNYIHDGNGPGVWFDGHIVGGSVVNNQIENLGAEGIFVEISRNIKVEGNTVVRAPYALTASRMNWCYGAGILVSTSDGVTVVGNEVTSSVHGILVIDQSGRADTPAGYDASHYAVQNNTVSGVDKLGACQDTGSTAVFQGTWSGNMWTDVRSLLRPLS